MEGNIARQLIAALAATMSLTCAGFHVGWSSPSLPKLLADDSDLIITSSQSSWIASLVTLGSTVGSLIALGLGDRLGRRWSLLITVVPYLSSAIFLSLAQDFWLLAAGRFTGGLGIGIAYTILPMYLGEIADDRIRGALGALINQMFNAGILLTYCIGPWVSRVTLACLGGILPLLFGLTFFWMPDSPYFMIMKQQPDRAKKSLSWLRGRSDVISELEVIRGNVEKDKKNTGTVRDLLMIPGNRKALIIVLGVEMAEQFSGIGAILSYTSLIFAESGSSLNSSISVIIVGVVQVLSGLLTIFTVDLTGRKPLLMISVCGSIVFLVDVEILQLTSSKISNTAGLSMIGEALFFQLQAIGTDVSPISWIPVTSIVGYIIFYTIGLGSLPYVIASELFPTNVKALGTMSISIVGALGGMVTMKLYQIIADAYGIHTAFWGFAVITVFSGFFIYFVLPETKQRSLRDIQDELHGISGADSSTITLEKLAAAYSPLPIRTNIDNSKETRFTGQS